MAQTANPAMQRSSIAQHAAIITLRDVLRTRNPGAHVQCFAQDPAYSDDDKTVLQRAGITVLEDPRAFCEVDDSSIVLSAYPNIPVRQVVMDIARPAIMIWNKVTSEQETLSNLISSARFSNQSASNNRGKRLEDLEAWL